MATAVGAKPNGLVAVSRAVVAAAADLAASVERAAIRDDRVRTARGNAYAAICADRARARARDEMDALVRALLANGPRTAAGTVGAGTVKAGTVGAGTVGAGTAAAETAAVETAAAMVTRSAGRPRTNPAHHRAAPRRRADLASAGR